MNIDMKDASTKEETNKSKSGKYHMQDCDFSSGDEETTLIDSQDNLNSSWQDSNLMDNQPLREDFSHVSIFSQPFVSGKALGRVSVQAFKYFEDFFRTY